MTWESVIGGALQGISNFVNTLVNVVTGSLNQTAVEGLSFLFLLGIVLRVLDGGVRMPKLPKRKKDDEEEEWILVRRKK